MIGQFITASEVTSSSGFDKNFQGVLKIMDKVRHNGEDHYICINKDFYVYKVRPLCINSIKVDQTF